MSFVPLPFVHVPVTHLSYSSSTSVTSPVTELPPSPLRPPLPVPLGPSPGGIGSGAQLVAMARERHPLQAHAREQAMAGRRASTQGTGRPWALAPRRGQAGACPPCSLAARGAPPGPRTSAAPGAATADLLLLDLGCRLVPSARPGLRPLAPASLHVCVL